MASSSELPPYKDNELPLNALHNTSECLLQFNEDATIENPQLELTHLTPPRDGLKPSLNESTECQSSMMEEEDPEIHLLSKKSAVLLFPPPAVKLFSLQQYMDDKQIPTDTVMYSSGMSTEFSTQ